MKKIPFPNPASSNPRILVAVALCSAGMLLAMLGFAATPPSGMTSVETKASAQGQTYQVLHEFFVAPGYPYAGLIQGSDGNFYGTTVQGGATNQGTVFKMDSSGAVTTLHSFAGSDGAYPYAGLIQGSDGNFYGTTFQGGANSNGTAFKMDSSGAVTTLHSFAGQRLDGAYPSAGLVQGSDGNFYGTTQQGGVTNDGTVFKMDASGAVTTLHSFVGQPLDGRRPYAGLIQGSDGNFYGTTLYGGTTDRGTVFKITLSGAFTLLYSFAGSDGWYPYAGLIQGSDGNFYGTTYFGGAGTTTFGNGTVFKITLSGAFTSLYSFAGSDGARPLAGLIQGRDGNFYGTTTNGGAAGTGTVFKITLSGAFTSLYSFAGGDGANPYAGLIQGSDGNFYGTTAHGGATNQGTVFKMDSSGATTTLHSFAGSDGATTFTGLIQGSDGNFYGTTTNGGANSNGTVFKMDSSGAVTTLHSFALSDGAYPFAGLIQGRDGNFYGTTILGGATNQGTAFKMDSSGAVTTLHSFAGQPLDGANPFAGLIQGRDGNFYGTTQTGGATNPGVIETHGTVFKMDSAGAVTMLHSFAGSDGSRPGARLIQGSDGNFYGTTIEGGGTADLGTVFKMDSSGAVTTLHSFAGSDGAHPLAGLIQGSDGNFYGTTELGGAADLGTVFKMDSSGAVTTLHSFAGSDGAGPYYSGLIQGRDGNFYGTTTQGGRSGLGVVFRINIAPPALTSVVSRKTHDSAGTFDVNLPLTGTSGIECRSGGANGNYSLVFTFVNNTTVTSASVTSGTGSVASSSLGPNPNQYTVNLTGVTNGQYVTVTLNGALDSMGNSGNVVGPKMGVLLGDVNASGRVDAADVSLVRQQTLQPVTTSNFREDINATGRIDSADVSAVRQQTLTSLP